MATFSAMYQKLWEFIQAKGPSRNLWISESISMKTFFSPSLFPYLRNNRKSNSNADLLLPEITIHLEKVKLSKFIPKRKIFLLCMGKKPVKYSESITKSNSHPIPSITQEDITQQLLTSSFKTVTRDDFYLYKSPVVFINLMGMLEKSAKWLTGEY